MNVEQHDIEDSKAYLLSLIIEGKLRIEIEQINGFVNFIAESMSLEGEVTNLLSTIKSFSQSDFKVLENNYISNVDFDKLISKAFKIEARRRLKNTLINLEKDSGYAFDESITKAFQIEKRKALKEKLQGIEYSLAKQAFPASMLSDKKVQTNVNEVTPVNEENSKVFSIKPFLIGLSIAASLLLIVFVWQPQNTSDKTLLSDYKANLEARTLTDFEKSDLKKESSGVRGEEELFNNYTFNETNILLEAIQFVRTKQFARAEEIFTSLRVQKEKNPGLTLYLSIAQLENGSLEEAVKNLEYLTNLSDFSNRDDAKFHLAFAYLKMGDRGKAKILLTDLVISKSKFAEQAKQTLKKIRWF